MIAVAVANGGPNPATVPIYTALVAGVLDGELATFAPTQAMIWRAIDALRIERDTGDQIDVLERVSIELHALQQDVRDGCGEVSARARIASLTDRWMGLAVLCR